MIGEICAHNLPDAQAELLHGWLTVILPEIKTLRHPLTVFICEQLVAINRKPCRSV